MHPRTSGTAVGVELGHVVVMHTGKQLFIIRMNSFFSLILLMCYLRQIIHQVKPKGFMLSLIGMSQEFTDQ